MTEDDEREATELVIQALVSFAGEFHYKLNLPDLKKIAVQELVLSLDKRELTIKGIDGDVALQLEKNKYKS